MRIRMNAESRGQGSNSLDYITRIGNGSHGPIVIMNFATADLIFLRRTPAILTEQVH